MQPPSAPGYYLARFDGIRVEVSAYWTGDRWEYRFPNGITHAIAPPLSWREFPEWKANLPVITYEQNAARSRRMAELYCKSGRDRPEDPMRLLMTGLAEQAQF